MLTTDVLDFFQSDLVVVLDFFQSDLAVVLDFLTLQDKHNINTVLVKIKIAFLPVSNA
jgi:hypothetical protein